MSVIDKIPKMVQPNVYNVIDQMENNIIIIYFFSTVILSLQMICSTEGIIQHEWIEAQFFSVNGIFLLTWYLVILDSTKWRLQTDCRPLFSVLQNNGIIVLICMVKTMVCSSLHFVADWRNIHQVDRKLKGNLHSYYRISLNQIMLINKFVRNLSLKKCLYQEKWILKSLIFTFKFRGRRHLE